MLKLPAVRAGFYNAPIAMPTEVRADFPADPASAGQARRFVDTTLRGWGCDGLRDSATLLVSELVSNAILHAGTTIRVVIRPVAHRIRVEVHDGETRAPTRKHYSSLATTGRGLLLVERLAADWGVEADGAGKRVWFELDRSGGVPDPLVHLDFDLNLDDLEDVPLGDRRAFEAGPPPSTEGDEPQLRSFIAVGCR